jgi:hypothetical protein
MRSGHFKCFTFNILSDNVVLQMNKVVDFFNRPWYGNYVGPGNNPGMPPVGNGLDRAAQIHDMAYGSLGAQKGVLAAIFDLNTVKVDWEFVIRAFAAIGTEETWQSKVWAVGTTLVFGIISICKTVTSLLMRRNLSSLHLFFPKRGDSNLAGEGDPMLNKINRKISTSDPSKTD